MLENFESLSWREMRGLRRMEGRGGSRVCSSVQARMEM